MSATGSETATRVHDLKTWPRFFADVAAGIKTFELRRNDRAFQRGDTLLLREYDPTPSYVYPRGRFMGPTITVEVTYVLTGTEYGLRDGYCALGFRHVGSAADVVTS